MIRKRMERSHTIMAKWMKKLLGLAAIGSAAAGLVYYFKKSKKDVDNDLQPVDRGYVDLNAGKASPEEADDAEETETGEDTLDADAHEGKED